MSANGESTPVARASAPKAPPSRTLSAGDLHQFQRTIIALETFRFDVLASLAFTWSCEDLAEPVWHMLPIAAAPSPTKDAIAIGLLDGLLEPFEGGLAGPLSLSALGRLAVRRYRYRTGWRP